MFERFTDRARRCVVLAQEEARLLDHNYIGTEHLLLGLTREGEGIAAQVLLRMDVSLERVRDSVEKRIGRGSSSPSGHVPFTPRAKKVLELSLREALHMGHNYIGTEHLLLGLLREGEGVAAQTLAELGVELPAVSEAVLELVAASVQTDLDAPPGEATGEVRPAGPNCPGCWGSLEGGTTSKVVALASEDTPSEERRVRVVYCSSCGRALGVLPE